MKSCGDSGLAHVTRGESTIDELMRVVDVPVEDYGEAPRRRSSARRRREGAPFRQRRRAARAAPPEPAVSTHFDLLEEPALPRASGPHGSRVQGCCSSTTRTGLRKVMKDLLERDAIS